MSRVVVDDDVRAFRLGLVEQDELVLAAGLRGHHPGLGARRELSRVHRMLRAQRDTDRDGHRAGRLERLRRERLGKAARQSERGPRIARRHDHRELFAADPAHHVGGAHDVAHDPADILEQVVARAVAVHVVHPLEVVEVEHQDGDGLVRARRLRQLDAESLVEVAVVVEPGQRIRLGEMLEMRLGLRVVERERSRIAEPLRQLELVLDERRLLADPVDVERTLERPARDERHDDDRFGVVRRPGDDVRPRIEVRLVRPDRGAVLGGPAGQADPEGRPVAHDLLFVLRGAREDRNEPAVALVGLVDVQRLVGHQIGERLGDALQERVERLLREHLVEHLGQAAVGLDERLGSAGTVRLNHPEQGRSGRDSPPDHFPASSALGRVGLRVE